MLLSMIIIIIIDPMKLWYTGQARDDVEPRGMQGMFPVVTSDFEIGKSGEDFNEALLQEVILKHFQTCHMVFVTGDDQHPFAQSLISEMFKMDLSMVTIDATKAAHDNIHNGSIHLTNDIRLWGDHFTSCAVVVIHFFPSADIAILDFLKESKLMWKPHVKALVIGDDSGFGILKHSVFMNTIHALYFAVEDSSFFKFQSKDTDGTESKKETNYVDVYWKCLYCSCGEVDVRSLSLDRVLENKHKNGSTTSSTSFRSSINFPDQLQNFMGCHFQIVTLPYFPYTDFIFSEDEQRFLPADSLDTLMVEEISRSLNFTFQIEEPRERQWGIQLENGSWTGIVGALEKEDADFSFLMSPTEKRRKILDHSNYYSYEAIVIVSSKPKLLPQHLALVRPLSYMVWIAIVPSFIAISITMWALQKGQSYVKVRQHLSINLAFLYSWGTLFANPPSHVDQTNVGKMFMGWWLLSSFILNYAYKSSLIAHLTVQGRSRPIDSVEDLLRQSGWTWGAEGYFFSSSSLDYFDSRILENTENNDLHDGLKKVLEQNHAFFTWKQYILSVIESRYVDSYGRTPFYLSKRNDFMTLSYSWGFRKGAPFLDRINIKMMRLLEAGLGDYWLKKVTERQEKETDSNDEILIQSLEQVADDVVVLNMNQLQGAFYLLAVGITVAVVMFFVEVVLAVRKKD